MNKNVYLKKSLKQTERLERESLTELSVSKRDLFV